MASKVNLKKILNIFIIIFWLIMMGILFSKEIILKSQNSAYYPFLSKDTLLSDQWLGIYFNECPIGFVHTSIEPAMLEKNVSGFQIVNRTWMNFVLLKKRNRVWFNGQALVDGAYRLRGFNFELNSGMHSTQVKGEVDKEQRIMHLEINSRGKITRKKIVLPRKKGIVVASIISPFSFFGKLKVGAEYNIEVFNPFTLEFEPLAIKVAGKEKIVFQDESVEAFIVKSNYRNIEQISWVNPKGEILREETLLGWVLLKESADRVSRIYRNVMQNDIELTEHFSLVSNVILPKESLKYLKVKFTGIAENFMLDSSRQRISKPVEDGNVVTFEILRETPDAEKALGIPIKDYPQYVEASDFIQSDDAAIRTLARKIANKEKNSWVIARNINRWVYENIRKTPVVSIPSAIDVLETREGDCNEHAALYAALTRALGIPTKINVGLTYNEGRFYYHAWCSVYVGEWIDIDPAFGQSVADVTHIKFLEGDLNKQLEIANVIGKISLEVTDYK
ncbi:MAG: transglutaminase family protein [Candidatus Omnitrophota bacterium]